MAAKKLTFEQQIARLEEIVSALEQGDVQLADSLALFEEGTKLIAACTKQLDQAEQQVVKLMKGPGGAPVELPFESTGVDGGPPADVFLRRRAGGGHAVQPPGRGQAHPAYFDHEILRGGGGNPGRGTGLWLWSGNASHLFPHP